MKGPFHRNHLDMTSIVRAEMSIHWSGGPGPAYRMELHLDSAAGKKIADVEFSGTGALPSADKKEYVQTVSAPIQPVIDGEWHKLYIVGIKKDAKEEEVPVASWYIRLINR
jgi:hypothetical protein